MSVSQGLQNGHLLFCFLFCLQSTDHYSHIICVAAHVLLLDGLSAEILWQTLGYRINQEGF